MQSEIRFLAALIAMLLTLGCGSNDDRDTRGGGFSSQAQKQTNHDQQRDHLPANALDFAEQTFNSDMQEALKDYFDFSVPEDAARFKALIAKDRPFIDASLGFQRALADYETAGGIDPQAFLSLEDITHRIGLLDRLREANELLNNELDRSVQRYKQDYLPIAMANEDSKFAAKYTSGMLTIAERKQLGVLHERRLAISRELLEFFHDEWGHWKSGENGAMALSSQELIDRYKKLLDTLGAVDDAEQKLIDMRNARMKLESQ